MEIVKNYGNRIKAEMERDPALAAFLMRLGLRLEAFRAEHFSDSNMPNAARELNVMSVNSVLSSLSHPENCAWTNLFTPVELLQSFGLNCLSIEAMSSFISGFTCEDWFIDYAESLGIAPTLCSYHKSFIGAVDSHLVPPAKLAVSTSTFCDGNINTFRHAAQKCEMPFFLLDIPGKLNEGTLSYVEDQLHELIGMLENMCEKRFEKDELSLIIERENRSHRAYRSFLEQKKKKFYPTTLTLQMYMLFASHLSIGSKETMLFYEHLASDIKRYPDFSGKRLLWVHLLPFYQQSLKNCLNMSDRYQIQLLDMNVDYMEEMDAADPIRALARKMIMNIYNGSFERKKKFVADLADEMAADGVIHFCHWGCKQNSGGCVMLRDALKEKGLPVLTLDGDGIDRRNCNDGQTRTRIEAFLEMLEEKG